MIVTALRNWKPWFAAYDDPDHHLVGRLRAVQDGIGKAMNEASPGARWGSSACAPAGAAM
ncbi:hypothetical protein ACFWOJ_16955 [Streptomyces sp. NPDC058439]|uniref:hypothetical protein n=1 Tax=Streptomyces sp. NPDC058439 TaxID=3346500 RepID=UPI00364CE0D5